MPAIRGHAVCLAVFRKRMFAAAAAVHACTLQATAKDAGIAAGAGMNGLPRPAARGRRPAGRNTCAGSTRLVQRLLRPSHPKGSVSVKADTGPSDPLTARMIRAQAEATRSASSCSFAMGRAVSSSPRSCLHLSHSPTFTGGLFSPRPQGGGLFSSRSPEDFPPAAPLGLGCLTGQRHAPSGRASPGFQVLGSTVYWPVCSLNR